MLSFKADSLEDSILMYAAQKEDGKGDFMALTINKEHLEFRFDTGSGKQYMMMNFVTMVV